MGSEEMKKNLVVEDDNDSMMIDNSQAVLDSDEMKKNVVNEANDLMVNNSQPMFDSDLSLDMSCFSLVGSNIWFKLYKLPSDRDVDLIGTVQSWYVMGRLGAYNSSNLQVTF
uniref:Uncharacterized protein n=1 Tax=Tanacetum cinerariifolium TaxID=118510 RepID=A0A699RGX5_TANCI|nr:hypothetical protein [Tanacetum cinerariifolium]